MSTNQRRMFIGLDLSQSAKLAVHNWRERHLNYLPAKMIAINNLHITLSFLGNVPANKMESLDTLLQDITAPKIATHTTSLGTFLKPQVLFLGVNKSPELTVLAKQCRSVNNKLSIPQHHSEYRPHISLYRKHIDQLAIDAPPLELDLQFDQFHLFESISSNTFGQSPSYVKQMSYPLLP
jgi:RNA 2',3'-cyclic 3'-phosphodiesterase